MTKNQKETPISEKNESQNQQKKPLKKEDSSKEDGLSSTESISIQTENITADIERPPEVTKQKEKAQENINRDAAATEILDSTMVAVLNLTYLKDSEQLTPEEFKQTEWSKNVIKTMDHYFPNWGFDHPLFGLAMSTGAVLMLVNAKKPLLNAFQGGFTNETNQETSTTEDPIYEQEPRNPGRVADDGETVSEQLYTESNRGQR